MKNLVAIDDNILDHILKAYFCNYESLFCKIFNRKIVEGAVKSFLSYFENEDRLNSSSHLDIIKKYFSPNGATLGKTSAKLGVCRRTFYRYRQRYFSVLKNYILQAINGEIDEEIELDEVGEECEGVEVVKECVGVEWGEDDGECEGVEEIEVGEECEGVEVGKDVKECVGINEDVV